MGFIVFSQCQVMLCLVKLVKVKVKVKLSDILRDSGPLYDIVSCFMFFTAC